MIRRYLISTLTCSLLASGAIAQEMPGPIDRTVTYSPYPDQNFPNQVFFGDTHLHTSYSADAGMVGAIVGPDEAYRFARGETLGIQPFDPDGRPLRHLRLVLLQPVFPMPVQTPHGRQGQANGTQRGKPPMAQTLRATAFAPRMQVEVTHVSTTPNANPPTTACSSSLNPAS